MLTNLAPPSRRLALREFTAPLDWAGTALSLRQLLSLPKGDRRPIILAPGFLTDKWSMRPLRSFLCYLNYDAVDWNLGRNLGNVDEDIVGLGKQSLELCRQQSAPVTLIGWSLGGVICREVARLFPDCVKEVITLGTPISGGPKYTGPGRRYARLKNIDLDAFELQVLERNKQGFEQPITVLFSRRDGVVGWQAALDVYNPQAKHIEVDCTHLGIGIHSTSWRSIALTLAGQSSQLRYSELSELLTA